MSLKLGYYVSLGNLANKNGVANQALLQWAAKLRESGAGFCMFAGLPLDPVMVLREPEKLTAIITAANEQLAALEALGMGVCVRPKPEIVEQIKVLPGVEVNETTLPGGGTVTSALFSSNDPIPTPNYRVHRTSINAMKRLILGPGQYDYVAHEIHDLMNGHWRAVLVLDTALRDTVLYWGHRGLWIKEGLDFGKQDMPHVVHVALNAASASDPSPPPEECTGADIRDQVRRVEQRINERLAGHLNGGYRFMAHINTTPDVPVGRLVSMLAAANDFSYGWDALMLRLVKDGQTLADENGKHVVTPNVLNAVKECQWMTGA